MTTPLKSMIYERKQYDISRAIIIFLLLNTINNPSSPTRAVAPKINVTISKDLITKLCSKSLNPSLCYDLLKSHIGRPLTNATASNMASKPLHRAESHARGTRTMLESLYKGAIDPKNEFKPKYWICMAKYDDVMKFLDEGKRNAQAGKNKVLASYASSAMNRISSCDNEFARKPYSEPFALKSAYKKAKDLCAVIVVACNGV